jgi:drug/metabolite transporter (DMT)-like permease
MGLINITLPFFLITWAEQHTSSSVAAVLTSLVPLFSSIFAPIFIHDEPLRLNAIVGLVVGFLGVIVLTSRELGGASFDLLSDLALVGAAISYGAGAVYARRNVRGLPPMVPATFQVTFAFLVSALVALVLEHPCDARPSALAIGSIVWLGLLGSGFAYMAFFRLLAHWGAVRTTLVAYVIPVVGIALGAIVLQEPVDARLVIGTALVIAGVALVNSKYGRRLVYARATQDASA